MTVKLIEAMNAILRLIGLTFSCCLLLIFSGWLYFNNCIANITVAILEKLFGVNIQSPIPFHEQRQNNLKNVRYEAGDAGIIDSKTTYSSAKKVTFTPGTLIAKTQQLLAPTVELGSKQPDLLADDFQAVFPFVGPLDKNRFCNSMRSLNFKEAFPPGHDSQSNYFGFTVDPTELNRVWYFARPELLHSGDFKVGCLEIPKTYGRISFTAQVFSMSFNDDGKCYKFTGGYPVDRTSAKFAGLEDYFGIFNRIKPGILPFTEGCPWTPSLKWKVWYDRVPLMGQEWNNILVNFGLQRNEK